MLESQSARLAAEARDDGDIGRRWQVWDTAVRGCAGITAGRPVRGKHSCRESAEAENSA